MPSNAKIEVQARKDDIKLTFYFHNMTNLDRRRTVHALRPSVERMKGVVSVKAAEHSFAATLDDPAQANAVAEGVVRLFCTRFRITDPERARLQPALSSP
jgi:uncharacterized protein (DUF2345 family)